MHPPPDLNLHAAAALVRADFPELAPLSATLLGEGTDHLALDLGGQVVFRFPKRAETATHLLTEVRLTAWLAPLLPLAIPRFEFVRQREGAPGYAGYPRLVGTPALLLGDRGASADAIGPPLGTFLRRLHGASVEEARALGVPEDDDPLLRASSQDAGQALLLAAEQGHVSRDDGRRWQGVLSTPPSTGSAPACLIHGDLAAEHVLLDHEGVPTAVIDWSDAVIGDPARDLSGLLHWGGEPFLRAALEPYGEVDEQTLTRARWFAACRAAEDVAYGTERGLDVYIRAGQRALTWLSPEPGRGDGEKGQRGP